MRTGWFRQAHVKSESCYRLRLLLSQRRNLKRKFLDIENSVRHSLKVFGIRLGKVGRGGFEAAVKESAAVAGDAMIGRDSARQRDRTFVIDHVNRGLIDRYIQADKIFHDTTSAGLRRKRWANIVNVSKDKLGEESALLLGSLIVSMIGLAGFSRADSDGRTPYFLYLDEFHNFTTLMLANMMAELRKYGVGLILAHQYLHQLEPDIRHAVLGNAGTLLSFRVGPKDAPVLAAEFQPKFGVLDLVNLPNRNFYLKLQIDGAVSLPFSAMTRGA